MEAVVTNSWFKMLKEVTFGNSGVFGPDFLCTLFGGGSHSILLQDEYPVHPPHHLREKSSPKTTPTRTHTLVHCSYDFQLGPTGFLACSHSRNVQFTNRKMKFTL